MLKVIGCITEQHDPALVLLAALLCFAACFTAMSMMARAKAAKSGASRLWLAGAGILTGSGIWATHFIAMLAYKTPLAMGFDIPLTILSALIAMSLGALGFWLAISRAAPILGGTCLGGAIGAMHYVGMAAVEIRADAVWNPVYVVTSVLIGMALAVCAILLRTHRASWRGTWLAASLLTLAVVSLHFTGMSAVIYVPDPSVPVANIVIAPSILAIAVAAVAFSIVVLGLGSSLVDYHFEHLRRYIDELETTKRELLLAKFKAEAGSRAKSNFLANMSHELRTPLNAIIGFAELMRMGVSGPPLPAKYDEYVQDICKSGGHLLSLINDILDLAKIEAGRREFEEQELNVAELASKAVSFVQPQAAHVHIKSGIHTSYGLRGDERALVQILINLLSNAIKFSPEGGEVQLFASATEDGGLAVGVEDHGIGMTEEGLKTALEPFGQASPMETVEGRGTGLGLPIVKALVEAHDGVLRLQSRPNKGTRAWAEFPSGRMLQACRAA
jgi:NO-binding membrane sensor protein with MHYT domain